MSPPPERPWNRLAPRQRALCSPLLGKDLRLWWWDSCMFRNKARLYSQGCWQEVPPRPLKGGATSSSVVACQSPGQDPLEVFALWLVEDCMHSSDQVISDTDSPVSLPRGDLLSPPRLKTTTEHHPDEPSILLLWFIFLFHF